MSTGAATYRIREGVRRAKAWQMAGAHDILAVVQTPDGIVGPEIMLPIDCLLSPKPSIDISDSNKAYRFYRLLQAIQAGRGQAIPAIVVEPGTGGTRIVDVTLSP